MLINVSIIRVPSALEQQAGKNEELLVGPVAVTAPDGPGAIVKVSAEHAEELADALKANVNLRVVVNNLG